MLPDRFYTNRSYDLLTVELELSGFDFVHNDLVIIPIERWLPAQQYVEYDSNRPYVTFLIVLARENLWRNVVSRTHHQFHLLFILEHLTSPEVNQLNRQFVFVINKDVFRFDVSMRHLFAVTVRHRRQHLLQDECCVCLVEHASRQDLVEKFPAFTQLRHQVNVLLILENLIQSHNIRMVQVLQYLDLIVQSHIFPLRDPGLLQNLDSPSLMRRIMLTQLHCAVASYTCMIYFGMGIPRPRTFDWSILYNLENFVC